MNYRPVRCPHCGRELQVPEDAAKIVCMFCAQPIDLGETAEVSSAGPAAPAGEAARLFPQEAFSRRIRTDQLNAQSYPELFESYRSLIRPALDAYFREAETGPEAAAEAFSEALLLGFSGEEQRKTEPADFYGCRFTITALLIPAVLERGGAAAELLADRFLEKWNARFPKHPLGKATYSAISDGFRKRLCFITTAVCRELGKGDSCAELQEFRRFRDGWLLASPRGAEKIGEYYLYAPLIVRAVEASGSGEREYRHIWEEQLLPCLGLLRGGEMEACALRYEAMMAELERNWLAKSLAN